MLKLFRAGKDIVDCECGWSKEYKYNSQDPYKVWDEHLTEVQGADDSADDDELHTFKVEFRTHNEEMFIICSCGWSQQLYLGQTASKVWEERHMSKRRKRRQTQQPKGSWNTFVQSQAAGRTISWSGGRHSWDRIRPAAIEVFGGTFYAYSRSDTSPSESAS